MQFRFGQCSLDPARRELRLGGAAVTVEPQVFDLIEFLVRQRDHVVSRDALIENVWHGRIVSESTLATRINAARKAIGDDGTRQALIKTIPRKGVRFIGEVHEDHAKPDAGSPAPSTGETTAPRQDIRFCQTPDGITLPVASVGHGPVLLKTSNWINHIEYDWISPIFSPLFARLGSRFHLTRYDGRGNGLADRNVEDISFAAFVRDLETVAAAITVPRFALLGLSQGCATAIAYAVSHPERVSHLVLYGGYSEGRNRRGEAADDEKAQAFLAIMRQGWGEDGTAFMRAFSSIYLPSGTPEQIKWFADMQRAACSGEMAARLRQACDDIDVTALLPRITVPTLVIHARHDNVVPFAQGRLLASSIPGARLVTLDSENHVPLFGEPSWDLFVSAIEDFIGAS
jgi:DNA-binding winged helix-turn-helix (wHTH) protein/alpha-beta hydrolase superfamily lysophospholipase